MSEDLSTYLAQIKSALENIKLTLKEKFVIYFMMNPGVTISFEDIYRDIWGTDPYGEYLNVIRYNISHIRRQLPGTIYNVRGKGYMYVPDAADPEPDTH